MKKKKWIIVTLVAIIAIILLAVICKKIFTVTIVSIPRWSIGLYEVEDDFYTDESKSNPVLSAFDIKSANAYFAADPFVIKVGSIYYIRPLHMKVDIKYM